MLKPLILGWLALAPPADGKAEKGLAPYLSPPVRIEADGKPIDTEVGHAAPFVGDFDGDGTPDLLVGQFAEGKLRVYRNVATAREPRFDKFEWFKAGGDFGKVPYG